MKLQSSLEFVVLLAAVAIFSIFVLSQYAHLQSTQKLAFQDLSNSPELQQGNYTAQINPDSIYMYAVMPSVVYVGRGNGMQVVLSYPESYKVDSVSVKPSETGAAVLPGSYNNVSYSLLNELSFSIVPSSIGPVNLSVSVELSSDGQTLFKNSTVSAMAEPQNSTVIENTNNTSEFAAEITDRNESTVYGLQKSTPVYTVYEWDRGCAVTVWENWPVPAGAAANCGSNSWGYYISTPFSCYVAGYSTGYYICFDLRPSNATITNISSTQANNYSFVLNLQNKSINTHTLLSSMNKSAPIVTSAGKIGTAKVNSMSGPTPSPLPYVSYIILNDSGTYKVINQSAYRIYMANLSAIEGQLKAINNSGTSNPNLYPKESNTNVTELENNAAITGNGCAIKMSAANVPDGYSCSPQLPFSYDISANLTGYGNLNQSASYQGSIITIK